MGAAIVNLVPHELEIIKHWLSSSNSRIYCVAIAYGIATNVLFCKEWLISNYNITTMQ